MRRRFTRVLLLFTSLLPFLAHSEGGPCNLSLSHIVTDETCPGFYDGSIDLSVTGANGMVTYQWSTGATSQDISSLTSGTYMVTATDQLGCMAYDTATVGASYVFTVDLGPDTTLCDLSNFLIHATTPGAVFYYWQNGSTDSTFLAQGPGSYDVFVQDANGCYDQDTIVLNQHVLPYAAIATLHPGCGGAQGALDLTVSSGTPPFAYNWSSGDTVQDLNSLPIGNYTVTVTDSNQCMAITSALVVAPTSLSDYIVNTAQVCNSHNLQFSPLQYAIEFDGANDYIEVADAPSIRPSMAWTIEAWVMPTGSSGPAETVIEKRTNSEDGYSIRFDPVSRQLSVRLQNGPFLAAFTPTTVLTLHQWSHFALVVNGNSVSFFINGSPVNELSYSGGIDPTVGTPLTIGGGPNRESFRGRIDEVRHWEMALTAAEVNELRSKNLPMGQPNIGIHLSFNELPGGSTPTDHSIHGIAAHCIYMDTTNAWIQANPMGMNFLWDFGDGTVNNSQAPFHAYLPRVWQTMVTNLTVTSTQGCQSSDTLLLPVHTPAVPFINADSADHYCIGDTVRLWIQNGYDTYSWSTGDTIASIFALNSGTFTATADDGVGCIHTGNIPIHFNPNATPVPVITPAGSHTICDGDTLALDAGSGYAYYLWSTGDTTSTIGVTDSGGYTVTVRNGFGCEHTSDTVHVNSYPPLPSTITVSHDTLYASTGFSYQWFFYGTAIPGAISNFFIASQSGDYTVMITGMGGCTVLSDPYSFAVGLTEVHEWGKMYLYPNPTPGMSHLQLSLQKPMELRLSICDLTGKVLVAETHRLQSGTQVIDLPTASLSRGVYIVAVEGNGQRWMHRLSRL